MSQNVYLLDASMIRFFKYPDRTVRELAQQATLPLLKRQNIEPDGFDAVVFANSGWGRNEGQTAIRGEVALRGLGIQGMPIINVENACASGSTAVHVAYLRILAGASDCVLVVGAEKTFQEDPLMTISAFLEGMDVEQIPHTLEMAKEWVNEEGLNQTPVEDRKKTKGAGRKKKRLIFNRNFFQTVGTLYILRSLYGQKVFNTLVKVVREGTAGADRSPFMDIYATAARAHIKKYGLTQGQLAIVASKNRRHGSMNRYAQLQKNLSVDEVLSDRDVAYPFTRPMCAPVGDGAAAAILCSENFLKRTQTSATAKVCIRSSVLVSGTDRRLDEPGDLAQRAAQQAYGQAGIGPDDVDFAELHDATAFGEIHHSETLGFCPEGEGGELAASGATALGGSRPINTSGGLECRGHPVGATGIAQLNEVFEQMTGQAGERQIDSPRFALTENGGGNIGFEEAALAIHIFERRQ